MAVVKIREQHKKLADKWLECFNGPEAALFAGYSKSSARKQAYLVLERPEVQEYIQERLLQLQSERIASIEEVWEYLSSVMRGNETEEVVSGEYVHTIRPKIVDRNKAAELLGRGYKMFTDRLETEASGTVTIVNDTQLNPEGDDSSG